MKDNLKTRPAECEVGDGVLQFHAAQVDRAFSTDADVVRHVVRNNFKPSEFHRNGSVTPCAFEFVPMVFERRQFVIDGGSRQPAWQRVS